MGWEKKVPQVTPREKCVCNTPLTVDPKETGIGSEWRCDNCRQGYMLNNIRKGIVAGKKVHWAEWSPFNIDQPSPFR